jgi:hypothetical protein
VTRIQRSAGPPLMHGHVHTLSQTQILERARNPVTSVPHPSDDQYLCLATSNTPTRTSAYSSRPARAPTAAHNPTARHARINAPTPSPHLTSRRHDSTVSQCTGAPAQCPQRLQTRCIYRASSSSHLAPRAVVAKRGTCDTSASALGALVVVAK